MSTSLVWHSSVPKSLVDRVDHQCILAMKELRDAIKEKVGRTQPTRMTGSGRLIGLDPSRPGEPPKIVSKELHDSIKFIRSKKLHSIVYRVYSDEKKAIWMELGTRSVRKRPFFRKTVDSRKSSIVRRLSLAGSFS